MTFIIFKDIYYIYAMRTPKILIAILLLIIGKSSLGQKLNKVEREYFILGTLSDYMGRYLDPRDKNVVDRYDALEFPLIDAIDSVLKKDYTNSSYKVDKYSDSGVNVRSAKILSDTLFKKLNSYYVFHESGSYTSDGDPELDNRPILMGALKENIFSDDAEKFAFLAGAYVRFGFRKDTCYEILIANSLSKARVCYEVLKYFKCKPFYTTIQGNIPTPHMVYFHPTKEMEEYLNRFMYLRRRLEKSRKTFFDMVREGKIR